MLERVLKMLRSPNECSPNEVKGKHSDAMDCVEKETLYEPPKLLAQEGEGELTAPSPARLGQRGMRKRQGVRSELLLYSWYSIMDHSTRSAFCICWSIDRGRYNQILLAQREYVWHLWQHSHCFIRMFFEWCVMMPFRPRHLGGYVLRHRSQDAAAASTARRLRALKHRARRLTQAMGRRLQDAPTTDAGLLITVPPGCSTARSVGEAGRRMIWSTLAGA